MLNRGDGGNCVGKENSSRAVAAIGSGVVKARCHRCTGIMACDAPLSSSEMPRTNHPRGCGSNVRRPHLRNNADFATLLILSLTFYFSPYNSFVITTLGWCSRLAPLRHLLLISLSHPRLDAPDRDTNDTKTTDRNHD
jgi:hypothetical protein